MVTNADVSPDKRAVRTAVVRGITQIFAQKRFLSFIALFETSLWASGGSEGACMVRGSNLFRSSFEPNPEVEESLIALNAHNPGGARLPRRKVLSLEILDESLFDFVRLVELRGHFLNLREGAVPLQ
jgi:hypothetical protein